MSVLDERLCVCRVVASPSALLRGVGGFEDGSFLSITRTSDELSIVCPENEVPEGAKVDGGRRAMKVEDPLDLSMVGVLASITTPLAEAGVCIFVVSTFDTDYVLVKEANLEEAVSALEGAGHSVATSGKSRNTSDK